MLNISRLYCNIKSPGDALRYAEKNKKSNVPRKPIVVWNITNKCILNCNHCYASANCHNNYKEYTTSEAKKLIDSLSEYKIPVLLFSGGEPLLRNDIFELIEHTVNNGVRAVLSTNGMLINDINAEKLKKAKITYAGISLDGRPELHNSFRGNSKAFSDTITGIRNCIKNEIKVGLRFTIFKENYMDIPFIFDLMEEEKIPRICFYHLVCSGRGDTMKTDDLNIEEKRSTVNLIIDKAKEFYDKGLKKEILTVDNHCDGVFLYLRMLKEKHPEAEEAIKLLRINKSDSSGMGIASINWDGTVFPDQFWRNKELGNLRKNSFKEIWENKENEFLYKLRNKRKHITGRCSECRFLDICGGNFRPRAEAITGDMWASDPGCYLYDSEIFN